MLWFKIKRTTKYWIDARGRGGSVYSSPELNFWSPVVRLSVFLSVCKFFTFSSSSLEPLSPFQPNLAHSILGWWANGEPRPFPREYNNEMDKIKKIKKIFFRTTCPISTKLGYSSFFKWRAQPFSSKWDNNEIAEIHWWNYKIFFSGITEPISMNLETKHIWVKGIQACSNKGLHPFPRGDNYTIAKIPWPN